MILVVFLFHISHLDSWHTGVSCDEQRIVFNGKQLEDTDLLSLCGVEEEATLYCLGSLLGGAKKRKKKTYTKPKKQKHKHKKASDNAPICQCPCGPMQIARCSPRSVVHAIQTHTVDFFHCL